MKKLLFFDIDGTLYDNANDNIPQSTIEALELLKANPNVEIAIATGRSNFILNKVESIMHFFDAFVFLNGLHVVYKGEDVFTYHPDQKDINKLIDSLKESNLIHGCFNKEFEYISKITEAIELDFASVNLDLPIISEICDVKGIMQLYFFGKKEELDFIQTQNSQFRVVPWHTNGADVLPLEISKDAGIRFLADKLGYSMDDVITFGDAPNDLEMIMSAGIGVAMGNATEHVKENADYVTANVENDGLSKALKHFNLI